MLILPESISQSPYVVESTLGDNIGTVTWTQGVFELRWLKKEKKKMNKTLYNSPIHL